MASSQRCIAAGYPPGCRGGWEGLLPRRPERLELERRGGYCIVRSPVKAVFRRDVCEWLERIAAGERRHLLLLGPPGTGKSMFLEAVRRLTTARVIEVEVETLFSHLVGEAEKKLRRLFDEAESVPPTIIMMDEADRLLQRRSFGGGGFGEGGYAEEAENMIRIMLRKLQQWSNEGYPVSVMATSNMPLGAVDPALVRSGRFTVLYFPVPDAEAVRLLFELYGKRPPSDEKIEELLTRSPSYANIVDYIQTGRLREYEIAPFLKIVVGRVNVSCDVDRVYAAIVPEEHPVAAVVAAIHAWLSRRRPLLLLLDPNRWEDAVWLARSIGWPVAIPHSPMIEDKVYSIIYRVGTGVYLLGQEWRVNVRAVTVNDMTGYCREHKLRDALGCKFETIKSCMLRWMEERLASTETDEGGDDQRH